MSSRWTLAYYLPSQSYRRRCTRHQARRSKRRNHRQALRPEGPTFRAGPSRCREWDMLCYPFQYLWSGHWHAVGSWPLIWPSFGGFGIDQIQATPVSGFASGHGNQMSSREWRRQPLRRPQALIHSCASPPLYVIGVFSYARR